MKPVTEPKRAFPKRFNLQGQTVVLRPLGPEDGGPMITFARGLPQDDLLFLQRDITQQAEVDWWIRQAIEGSLVTLVAWQDKAVLGYATFDRGTVRWARHVAELRVVVARSARGIGLGKLLLQLVFEMALEEGVTKVIARMTPDQTGALNLFKRLGFEEEAVLRNHAMGASGETHDLVVLSFHTSQHQEQCCTSCGIPVLTALSLDGFGLCANCYQLRYQELGGGG